MKQEIICMLQAYIQEAQECRDNYELRDLLEGLIQDSEKHMRDCELD